MFVFLYFINPPKTTFANIYWGTFLSSVWKFQCLVHHSFCTTKQTLKNTVHIPVYRIVHRIVCTELYTGIQEKSKITFVKKKYFFQADN